MFCDERTGKPTDSSPPNFLCEYFRIQLHSPLWRLCFRTDIQTNQLAALNQNLLVCPILTHFIIFLVYDKESRKDLNTFPWYKHTIWMSFNRCSWRDCHSISLNKILFQIKKCNQNIHIQRYIEFIIIYQILLFYSIHLISAMMNNKLLVKENHIYSWILIVENLYKFFNCPLVFMRFLKHKYRSHQINRLNWL